MADPRLNIRIGADLAEIKKALSTLGADLRGFKKSAEGAGQRMGAGLDFAKRAALQLGTALGAAFSLRALAAASDEAAELNARLKLATKSTEEFNRASAGTFDIAQRTRTSLRATAELYARIERSTRDLSLNQATILQLTETINQAAQLSGGGPGTEAALFQLSQGLASGTLRGEELNSVLEQTPRLAQAIADGMNIPVGKLRELAAEGKITTQDLLRALLSQSSTIEKEFGKLPTTIGGAMTKIRNAFTKMVGDADQASGASRELVTVLEDLAEFLKDPATAEGFATLGAAIARIIKLMSEATVEFAEFGRIIARTLASATGNLSPLDDLEGQIKDVDRALKNSFMGKPTKYLFTSEAELNAIKAQLVAERDALLAAQGGAPKAAPADQVGVPGGGGGGGKKGKASDYRADLELLRDSVDRSLAELERLYEAGNKGLADYFAEKRRLQAQAIDAALEQARTELRVADSTEARQKALVGIAKLERDRAELGPAAAREQAAAEEELAKALGDVHTRLLEAEGQTRRARIAQMEGEFRDLIVRLKANGDEAGVAIVRKLINVEAAKAELSELRDQVDRTISDLRGTEELVAAQDDAGQISPWDAEEQLQAVRERSIEQLKRYREALVALAASSNGDPEVVRQLQVVDTEIARVTANMDVLGKKMKDQAVQSLSTFFSDLATGAKSFGDAFRDLVLSFVQGIAQMIAQELALKAVRGILSAMGGTVAVQHSGGMAGQGGSRRVSGLTMAMFAGAPRFHSGGLPGLRADEVPAILQKGEEVLSRTDERNVLNGGGRTGSGGGTRVINVIDPALVQDYLDSPQGEEAILNVIGRNPGRVKQVVG